MEGFKLSEQQKRVWRRMASKGGTASAVCAQELILDGDVDGERLERTLAAVLSRAEIARTAFPLTSGMALPLQVIAEPEEVTVALERRTGAVTDDVWQRWFREPFDPCRPPLVRAVLISHDDRHHLWLAAAALVADTQTVARWLAETVQGYGAGELGAGAEALQYADYAAWQEELLESPDAEEGRRHWATLAEAPGLRARLGNEVENPEGEALPPGTVTVDGSPLAAALESAAAEVRASPGALLLAAWGAVLGRRTGEARPIVATVVSGRNFQELEDAAGPFARAVPQPLELSPGLSFRALAAAAEEGLAPARDWAECFPVVAFPGAYGFAEVEALPLPGGWSLGRRYDGGEPFTALLEAEFVAGRLHRLQLTHAAARLPRPAALALLEGYRTFLERALHHPEAPLDILPVASAEEEAAVLRQLYKPEASAPEPPHLVATIAAQAVARKAQPIVHWAGGERAFGEVDAAARQLAGRLRRRGVGPEVPVALYLDRSPELLTAILAVLYAGGAYVPLDPAAPAARLQLLLEDAQPALVVSREGLVERLPETTIPTLRVDEPGSGEAPVGEIVEAPAAAVAYILYTSGSTGRPKGVEVTYGNVAAYVAWCLERYGLGAGGGVLWHSPLGFDLTVTSVLAPLAAGTAVHLFPESAPLEDLAETLRQGTWDLLKVTPAHLEALAGLLPEGALAGRLGTLIIGGDALYAEALESWSRIAPDARYINEYGPTETTVGCAVHEAETGNPGAVPIGGPITGARLAVVDRHGALQPPGTAGELWIGGAGVARGYRRDPRRTAASFRPDPFAGEGGARLYTSGDRVRQNSAGDLVFRGRLDHQVKIRGFRIEPGEIEAVLQGHPKVRECVVVPWQESLAAYFTVDGEGAPAAEDLTTFLRQRLPEYMLPGAFVALSALPLNDRGKVDLPALPPVERASAPFQAPSSPEEMVLAEIWAEILGLERVGVRDNFFDLGGDSIRSVQVRVKAQQRGFDITVQELLQAPTIETLAPSLRPLEARAPEGDRPGAFDLVDPADRPALPAGLEAAYPLSQLQAGMLFHSKLNPDSAVYHDINRFRLRLPWDHSSMVATLAELTARHAILRTSFDLSSYREPLQLVHRRALVPLVVEDLRQKGDAAQRAAVTARIEAEQERGFAWREAPLLRLFVLLCGEAEWELVMSDHHAILDGWSSATFLTELLERYSLRLRGEEPPALAPLRTHYRDFIALERETVASPKSRDFWLRQLEDYTFTALPEEPAAMRPGSGAVRPPAPVATVPPAVTAGLQGLARQLGIPFKSVLVAAHGRALAALCGTDDVLTGSVLHGRPETEDGEAVLGLFLNATPLRLRFRRGSWRDLARQAFEVERAAMPHRRFPMAEVQRLTGGQNLFESAFTYVNFHVTGRLEGADDFSLVEETSIEETNYALGPIFDFDESRGELRLILTFDPARHSLATVEGWMRVFQQLLAAMAEEPSAPHHHFCPLSPAEREQLRADWAQRTETAPQLAHRLFEERVLAQPEAMALMWGEETLSFDELNRRSNRLAAHLRAFGVGPDLRVGLALETPTWKVIASLAVLKAGGAFVPLETSQPLERLAHLLEDAGIGIVVTEDRVQKDLPTFYGLAVNIDADGPMIDLQGEENLAPLQSLDHLAYVIYTSGSTGRPKGVMVSHRGIANMVEEQGQAAQLGPHSRVLQFASSAFDASIWEVFGSLLRGALVVLATAEERQPGEPLLRLLKERRITQLTVPPSVLEVLPEGELPDLETVFVAGEACTAAVAARWAPRVRLINAYGPTETTVCATVAPPATGEGAPPIGRALGQMCTYLVDPWLQPVLPGTAGELLVAGAGLARGYLNRPALTAEAFVPNPWSDRPGDRLYRTGDLVRELPDGVLEFLGRRDHQVKVRGYRIEVGEVEAALAVHPAVATAAVVVRGSGSSRRLVGCVEPAPGRQVTVAELATFLGGRLPEFMVPDAFLVLESMPRTLSDKVDRRRLVEQAETQVDRGGAQAPRTATELALAQLFQELLDVPAVGIREDFFSIGGHSLLAVQLVARLESRFGVALPMGDLFQGASVERLASLVEGAQVGEEAPLLVPLQSQGEAPSVFWVHPSGGNVLCYLELARLLGTEQPFYGLQAQGLTTGEPQESVEAMATSYLEAIRSVQPAGPYHLAGWSLGGILAYEMAQQLRRAGEEVASLTVLDARYPDGSSILGDLEESTLLAAFAEESGLSPEPFEALRTRLASLPPDAGLGWLVEEGIRSGSLPPAFQAAALERLFSVYKANLRAAESYMAQPYPGQLLLVRSEENPTGGDDPTRGWSTAAETTVVSLPGDHLSLLKPPFVQAVAEVVGPARERIGAVNSART